MVAWPTYRCLSASVMICMVLPAALALGSALQFPAAMTSGAGGLALETTGGRAERASGFSYADRHSRLRSLLQAPDTAAPSSFSSANCIVQAYNCPGCQTLSPALYSAITAGNCTALTAFTLYLCNNETLISTEVIAAVRTGQCQQECLQGGQQLRCSQFIPGAPAVAPYMAISAQLAPSLSASAPDISSSAAPVSPSPPSLTSPAPPPSGTTFQLSPNAVASPSPLAAGPASSRTVSAAGPASAIQFAGASDFAPVAPASGPAIAPTCPAGTQQPLWACGCTTFTPAAYAAIRSSAAAGTCADQSATLSLYICASYLVQPSAYQAITSGSCRLLCDQQLGTCSAGAPGPAPALQPQAAPPTSPVSSPQVQPPVLAPSPATPLAVCPPGSGQTSYQCGCTTLTPPALADIQQAAANGSCSDRSADLGVYICGSLLVQPDTYAAATNGSCQLQCGAPSQVSSRTEAS